MVCFDTTLYDAIGSGGRDFTFSWSRVLTFTENKLLTEQDTHRDRGRQSRNVACVYVGTLLYTILT